MSDEAKEIQNVKEETKSTVDPVKSFLSGGFGGVSCVLVGHPFDLTYVKRLPRGCYCGRVRLTLSGR